MYVYGVMRSDARVRLPVAGVDGRGVGRVAEGDLAALVGEGVEGPVKPSRRNVMAHSRVLHEVVATSTDVLPVQFGVVMPDGDAVREELLVAHAETLHAQLDEHAGRIELDITVTCPQDELLREVVLGDPQLERASRRLREAGAGANHQQRIALGEAVARAVEAEREAVAARTVDLLAAHAVDALVNEPRHEDMLANVAFLVERKRVSGFDTALEKLGAALGDTRRVRCVGPLPLYHFVDLALGQETAAWA